MKSVLNIINSSLDYSISEDAVSGKRVMAYKPSTKNLLGIDVGDKRVGIALSHHNTVVPLQTALRSGGAAESTILKLIEIHKVQGVVAGIPLGEQDEENYQTAKVRTFCRRLTRRMSLPLMFQDEYASTFEAIDRFDQLGRLRQRRIRERDIDALAAAVILERYLAATKDET